MGKSFNQNKWLERGIWNQRANGPIDAMKGQPCPVCVQRSRMNCNDRGAENIDVVLVRLVAEMPKESIPGSAVIGEVADSDNAFIAIVQFSSSRVQLDIVVVEFQVPLAQIKDITHVRCNMRHRQS